MKINISIVIFALLIISCSVFQKSISFEKVKHGEQLESAKEISVEEFFQIWMQNGHRKIDINCHELYKDSCYTYFGKNYFDKFSVVPNLYKVNSDSLSFRFGDYNKIDAQKIRDEYFEKVVPTSDKDILEDHFICENSSTLFHRKFDYGLNGKKIFITLESKIECEKGIFDGFKKEVVFEKKYNGYYDLNDMKIVVEQ